MPNIVFVLTDDMRPDEMEQVADLRPDGGFAWIRARATRTNLWYGDNLCCPSRVTMLTGQTASRHGVLSNDRYPDLGDDTLPAWMRAAGYCTGFTGKYLNHYTPREARPPGWDYWEPLVGRLEDEHGYGMVTRNDRTRVPGTFLTDELARVSAGQLRDCLDRGRPAFVALWPPAPHDKSDPAQQYADVVVPPAAPDPSFGEADMSDKPGWLQQKYPTPRRSARFAAIRAHRVRTLLSVDDAIMRIRRELAAHGAERRTVFVLTSDNGLLLGEHRIDRRKEFAYEAAQGRLWIAGPSFTAGDESATFVQNADITRTILQAAGASNEVEASQLDGVPLQQLVRDPARGRDRFLPLYVPVQGAKKWDRPTGEGVRTWRYKYVRYDDTSEELYDLLVDPAELVSVHADPAYARIRSELQALTDRAARCRGDACRASAPQELQG